MTLMSSKLAAMASVAFLMAIAMLTGPLAGTSQAATFCLSSPILQVQPQQLPVPNDLCVSRTADRGYRAYVDLHPPSTYVLAGHFHVELKREGNHVVNSAEFTNPTLPLTIATPWRDRNPGRFCAILWERRTATTYYRVDTHCHTFN